ncbi:MAG: hypothetical protein F6J90_17035 [Moorea sp. SIOASIH]|nr:hypothetical protein [Moorena sp. SIOASIH]
MSQATQLDKSEFHPLVSQENPGISHKSTRFLSDKMPKPCTCFGKKGLKALSGMPSAFMQQALIIVTIRQNLRLDPS